MSLQWFDFSKCFFTFKAYIKVLEKILTCIYLSILMNSNELKMILIHKNMIRILVPVFLIY